MRGAAAIEATPLIVHPHFLHRHRNQSTSSSGRGAHAEQIFTGLRQMSVGSSRGGSRLNTRVSINEKSHAHRCEFVLGGWNGFGRKGICSPVQSCPGPCLADAKMPFFQRRPSDFGGRMLPNQGNIEVGRKGVERERKSVRGAA